MIIDYVVYRELEAPVRIKGETLEIHGGVLVIKGASGRMTAFSAGSWKWASPDPEKFQEYSKDAQSQG